MPAQPGELFTLAADVSTWFAAQATQKLYRCWLEVECLNGQEVIAATASPELLGTHEEPRLLAVTAVVPDNATSVRAVLCAHNKQWSLVENRAVLHNIRLLRLQGAAGGMHDLSAVEEFTQASGAREVRLKVTADWPDGTAVSLSTDRGVLAPAVLLTRGSATTALRYSEEDVGRAAVEAHLGSESAMLTVPDPMAATFTVQSAVAEGQPTPCLARLTRDGRTIPGRYAPTVEGLFITPPWSIDLAPGEWQLHLSRGPRFHAVEQQVTVQSGETITIDRAEFRPVADLRARHWYGGDADGDVYHGELVYTDVNAQSAAEIAQAMGLDWVGCGRWGVDGIGGPEPGTWGEARAEMERLSNPNFLFMWTDERPKSKDGHACFVGLQRPGDDRFEFGWAGLQGPLRNDQWLGVIRAAGAATFVNHPLRWWMRGTDFTTNMYSSLPFDLCAAGRLDGLNINDKEVNLPLWSLLLDHGYQVAATAGADFCLDRPGGPPPGVHRMYCYCPEGLSPEALAAAVRKGNTVVSTGVTLLADVDSRPPGSLLESGGPHTISVEAWARGDRPDRLERIELWSHGHAIETRQLKDGPDHVSETFRWTPQGERDWVAVRAVSKAGWAMTSPFYAGSNWHPREPLVCAVQLDVTGLDEAERQAATVAVWDGPPNLVTSQRLFEGPLAENESLQAPVTATVVVTATGGKSRSMDVYEATGVAEVAERIAAGAEREQPLLDWSTYEDVLSRCSQVKITLTF